MFKIFWLEFWSTYFVPLLTPIVGGAVAWAALKQAKTARERHQKQTKADTQRRITESYAKAVEQLGSGKPEVSLGGIYTLERISRESKLDYWPIMETLTAFVRVRAPWKAEKMASRQLAIGFDQPKPPLHPPPADIEAVLAVIRRRDAKSRKREQVNEWRLDLTETDLRKAFLHKAHLEGADLRGTHLEGANLSKAHLEGAFLREVHLKGADLSEVHLEGADLTETHLEGADLSKAKGLKQDQIDKAFSNAETKLPEGLGRPANWPPA